MKSVSHLKIQRRSFPFPLWNNRTSVPLWCMLGWSDSLPTCHVWDPSCHLSLARSIGTWLIPHAHTFAPYTHTRCLRALGSEFSALSSTIKRIQYLSVPVHASSKAKQNWQQWLQACKKGTNTLLLSHGSAEHRMGVFWESALFKSHLSKGSSENVASQTAKSACQSKESPKGRMALLQVLCPLILLNWRGSSWQLQCSNSSFHKKEGLGFPVSTQHAHSSSPSEANQKPAWQWKGKATWLHDMNHLEMKSATAEPMALTPPLRGY